MKEQFKFLKMEKIEIYMLFNGLYYKQMSIKKKSF